MMDLYLYVDIAKYFFCQIILDLPIYSILIFGGQGTQKLNFDNLIRKMILDGGIYCRGLVPTVIILWYKEYHDETFHLLNRVIRFP